MILEVNGSETKMIVPMVESGRMEKMVGLSSDRWWYEDGGIVYQKKKKKKRWWYEDGGVIWFLLMKRAVASSIKRWAGVTLH